MRKTCAKAAEKLLMSGRSGVAKRHSKKSFTQPSQFLTALFTLFCADLSAIKLARIDLFEHYLYPPSTGLITIITI